MTDQFRTLPRTLESPGATYVAVTKHDSTDFAAGVCRGLYVGVSGDVVAVDADGNTCTFKSLAAGVVHPIRCKRVNSTSTTATDMVAIY